MKKQILLLAALIFCATLLAQAPQGITHQAVMRNAANDIVANQEIGIKVSILQGTAEGTAVYVETHQPGSNQNGLINFVIGQGAPASGSFDEIDWGDGPYFLKTEADPEGGTNYSITGTMQFLSVPYALHTKTVTIENDPLFSVSPASNITTTNISSWNTAYSWGNHSGLYKPDSWLPSWADVTAKPVVFPPDAHNHSATDVTSGTLNIARIPTGTTASTVSLGNHAHGTITNTGSIGSASGRIVTTGASGALQATAGTAAGQMLYWNGTAWVNIPPGNEGQVLTFIGGGPAWKTLFADVLNSVTGKLWMDRNLGAIQVATSNTDANSYGDLYQWGRGTDGHQLRSSGTTTTVSSSNTPGHSNFIRTTSSPYDWRSPQNDNLWQGVSGINNPCPSGYRLPTEAELNAERLSWSSSNAAGAFASALKLPLAGARHWSTGGFSVVGSYGFYWSSTVSSTDTRRLAFESYSAGMYGDYRAFGFSVRCIKN